MESEDRYIGKYKVLEFSVGGLLHTFCIFLPAR